MPDALLCYSESKSGYECGMRSSLVTIQTTPRRDELRAPLATSNITMSIHILKVIVWYHASLLLVSNVRPRSLSNSSLVQPARV
jgi:hypothetical protein